MSISTNDLNTLSAVTPAPATTAAAINDTAPANASQTNGTGNAQQVKLTPQITKQQLNQSILQASLEVSLTSQNDPLALVYKSAIESINDALKPQLGDNAIQNAASQDNSPEATAGRIVSFVKNAYAMYSQVNPMNPDGSTVDKFMGLIQAGVDKGFEEARGILDSLHVLSGDIAGNIDKTYDLVKQGLADFINSLKNPPAGDDGTTPQDGNAGASGSSTSVSVSVSVSVSQTQTVTTYS